MTKLHPKTHERRVTYHSHPQEKYRRAMELRQTYFADDTSMRRRDGQPLSVEEVVDLIANCVPLGALRQTDKDYQKIRDYADIQNFMKYIGISDTAQQDEIISQVWEIVNDYPEGS